MKIAGLMPRDPAQKDRMFGAGYTLECPHCGRLYDNEDLPKVNAGDPCPDEDCPTYWELSGKPFKA